MAAGTTSIIDVDSHVTEAADAWTSRVPARWRDRVPHVEADPRAGWQTWVVDGEPLTPVGATAVAGWRRPFPDVPPGYDEVHPAAHDAVARLDYLDENGIRAQVLYPNVGGFGSQFFLRIDEPDLKLACVRAYNDFLTEWCAADADRLLPITAIPFWDLEAAVVEIERCADLGHRGILFTAAPQVFGEPLLGDRHWDPLWRVAAELDVPVSFHIGSGDLFKDFTRERMSAHGTTSTVAWQGVKMFLDNGVQLADLLLSGVLPRHPDVRFVSVESGIGWVPFVLEAVDYLFDQALVREERADFDVKPSEYFHRQVYATVWFEDAGPKRLLDDVGAGNVLFETDFPHPACLFGDIEAKAARLLEGHEPAVCEQVLWRNAAELYGVELDAAGEGLAT